MFDVIIVFSLLDEYGLQRKIKNKFISLNSAKEFIKSLLDSFKENTNNIFSINIEEYDNDYKLINDIMIFNKNDNYINSEFIKYF